MIRPAVLALFMTRTQAVADVPQLLHFENGSSRAIAQIAIFPFEDGRVVDDVLAVVDGPIPPGARLDIDTRLLRCMPISVWARFADGEEVTATTDLCRNRRLRTFD